MDMIWENPSPGSGNHPIWRALETCIVVHPLPWVDAAIGLQRGERRCARDAAARRHITTFGVARSNGWIPD